MSEYRTFFIGPNFFEKLVQHLIIIGFVKFQAVSRLPVLKQPMGTTISFFSFCDENTYKNPNICQNTSIEIVILFWDRICNESNFYFRNQE